MVKSVRQRVNLVKKTFEVLIVEDNPADARLAQDIFKLIQTPNKVFVAEDGNAATDYLFKRGVHVNASTPDLVLLDLNLPLKDGREVLREIKNSNEVKSTPVLIFSTSNAPEDVNFCFDNYANGYFRKPALLGDFVSLVKLIESYWFKNSILPQKS